MQNNEKKVLAELDGIRVLAMSFIVCWHFYLNICQKQYEFTPFRSIIYPASKIGYYSVEVFFLLSGFCIAYHYKETINTYSLAQFIKKRLIGIFPLATVVTVVSLIIQIIDVYLTNGKWAYKTPIDLYHIILNFSLMQTGWIENDYPFPYNAPQWFLCILVLCYIIYWLISHLTEEGYLYACIAMCFIGYACMIKIFDIPFLYVMNGRGYLGFFLGCILYEFDSHVIERRKKAFAYLGLFINGILLVLICKYGLEVILGKNVQLIFTIFVFPIFIISALNLEWIKRALSLRVIQAIKKYVMSIFLWHQPFMIALRICDDYLGLGIAFDSGLVCIEVFIGILLVGILSYHLLERKLLWNILER